MDVSDQQVIDHENCRGCMPSFINQTKNISHTWPPLLLTQNMISLPHGPFHTWSAPFLSNQFLEPHRLQTHRV